MRELHADAGSIQARGRRAGKVQASPAGRTARGFHTNVGCPREEHRGSGKVSETRESGRSLFACVHCGSEGRHPAWAGSMPKPTCELIRGRRRGPAAALARLGLGATARGLYGLGVGRAEHRLRPAAGSGRTGPGSRWSRSATSRWGERARRRWSSGSPGGTAAGMSASPCSAGATAHAGGINDEGLVLEENLPDVPHLQDPDRVKLAEVAVAELESELIVLDDGFQHRRLARDLDLVMIDALDPFGLGRLFPRGLLREPVGSLRRASAVDPLAGRPARAGRTRGDPRRRSTAGAGCRFVESRHAPLDLIDGDGPGRARSSGLAGQESPPSAGSATPRDSGGPSQPLCRRVPRLAGLPRPSSLHGRRRRVAGRLGRDRWGRISP